MTLTSVEENESAPESIISATLLKEQPATKPLQPHGDEISDRLTAVFGQAVMMLMGSPVYREHSLKDLEWLVLPAIATGQLRLAKAQLKGTGRSAPVGLVMWASVSEEADKRLTVDVERPVTLEPDEWKSGTSIWIVDAVGESALIERMLRQLIAHEWAGSKVKLRARGKNGEISVGVLEKKDAVAN